MSQYLAAVNLKEYLSQLERLSLTFFICIYVVYYIKEMTLPILLIFYVSKWRNIKKHYKIEYDVAVTSSLGVESQN